MQEFAELLYKTKDVYKNKISYLEFEAYKLATRNEFQAIIEFKLNEFHNGFIEKFKRVDARLADLGSQCAEIVPFRTFQDYLRRQ